MALQGLMQHDRPLTLQHILERMRTMSGDSEVVTLMEGGERRRESYAQVAANVDRLCSALRGLGVKDGDRVGTFAWNTQEHLEAYLAIPCMGSVLHTINIRLFEEQLTYIVNHAEDKVIVVEASLVPVLERVASSLQTVEHYVVVGDIDEGALPGNVHSYWELLGAQEEGFDYPTIEDDRQAAGLCYTSGTTGNPKGALYSHRSTILHAMAQCMADSIGIHWGDRVLPVVPMFHVNAWGLPHACGLSGASLIMPSQFLQGEPLAKLIEAERVTVAGGVPTVWLDVLNYADEAKPDLSSLRAVPCGGSRVPLSLMQAFEERHGVNVVQAWGMTETSPVASVSHPPAGASEEEAWRYRDTAGRLLPLVEARLVGDDGEEVPWDGKSTGELEVRGPWVISSYYEDESSPEKFHDGWLRTGDIAAISPDGFVEINDRVKDVIKSGGEWISSVELETALMAHDAVQEAAVISTPHDRWGERPLACVVLAEGEELSPGELRAHLEPLVAKWWLPEEFAFVDEIPKTSVGKFDKKVLRQRREAGELSAEPAGEPAAR